MLNKLVSLTKKFISLKSTADNPKILDKILNLALSELKGFTTERFERRGIKSALIYNSQKRPTKFKIILNAHLDVIPGKPYQYAPQVRDQRLYGVGSMDMKANAACMIMAFREVAKKVSFPLGLQLTTDEEVGGYDGTKYQIDRGVRTDFVLAGEPTNFAIVRATKGILLLKISARGKSAHGAYPWRGKNAIDLMNNFLIALKKTFPPPTRAAWITTVNLSSIETTNRSFNKIPDDCLACLDIRFIPADATKILNKVRALLPSGFELEIVEREPAQDVEARNPYIRKLKKIAQSIVGKSITLRGAHGSSDARHFARFGGAGIEFGPIGGGIGGDREWVYIPSLKQYYNILTHFLLSLK